MKNRLGRVGLGLAAAVLFGAAACGGSKADADADFAGTWLGSLDAGGGLSIRTVFNLSRATGSGYQGTLDVPEQGVLASPLSAVDVTGRHVVIDIAAFGAGFAGDLSDDGATINGSFVQAGQIVPLVLAKQPGPLDYRRPQDPVPPYPYNSQDVTIGSTTAVTLAGTLTWPQGAGPFKSVVLIAESGPNNRNEDILNHRPFLVLSDALTRAGIATLRYDKRGVGASTGDYAAATSVDFADDARAAAQFLRGQSHFAVSSVGLVGHSEGGMIAPMVADGNAEVAFLVLLAAPGVSGDQIVISQQRAIGVVDGVPTSALDADEALLIQLFGVLRGTSNPAEHAQLMRAILTAAGVTGPNQNRIVAEFTTPWMRFFATYDPIPVLQRTTIPVLATTGSLDLQVLSDLNLPPIQAALTSAGNMAATVEEVAGLNHMFQHASTGSPREYATIEETMAPEVLERVRTWIGSR